MRLAIIIAFIGMCGLPLWAAPTESKEWTSTAGTKITAVAEGLKDGSVELVTSDGKKIAVPLASLVEEDRKFLREHFKPAPPKDLPYPIGKASGPHKAEEGASFYVYLPNSLREGSKAPLLIYANAGGGKLTDIEAFSEGAEINGWIVIASVESKNNSTTQKNIDAVRLSANFVFKTLPADHGRTYFSGLSGGGSMSMLNNTLFEGAGAMPIIGYNPNGNKMNPKSFYYVLGGATDYNRYMSADIANEAKDRGFHRIYPGGHTGCPPWIRTEAMIWMNAHFLKSKGTDRNYMEERVIWEENMIEWITKLQEKEPHRAYYWCTFLQQTYRIGGQNTARVAAIAKELSKNSINTRYAAGINEINEFSQKNYTGFGFGSRTSHVTVQIQSAAAELQRKYAGVPHVEEVVSQLGNKTVGGK